MYFLHWLDGGHSHRGSIVAITDSPTQPTEYHNIGESPLVDENGASIAFDNGWMLGPVETETNAKTLAYVIARQYNADVMFLGEEIGLPYLDATAAAAALGSITSPAKAKASRANGKKGGRPRAKGRVPKG